MRSGKSAVGAKDLAIHPGAVRPREERHDTRDVVGLSQAFEWRQLLELLDLSVCLSVEKQRRRHWAGRHRVHGDVSPAQLIGENMDETFDADFGSDIGAVGG